MLTVTLHALQLFTGIGLTLMMRSGASQHLNKSCLSLLEFGAKATTQKQIEIKAHGIYILPADNYTHVSVINRHVLQQYCPNESLFLPVSCDARTTIHCT